MSLGSFEKAFSDKVGSCRAQCACGKQYYNPDGGWHWEDGELEALEADQNATALDCSVGYVTFEGTTYVIDCNCWHERAKRISAFLDTHMQKIADYFKEERLRKTEEAAAVPSI